MRFQPQLSYNANGKAVDVGEFKTYAEIKAFLRSADMKDYVARGIITDVFVSRTRRGEWGEWFEYWNLVGGKMKITKEGWM